MVTLKLLKYYMNMVLKYIDTPNSEEWTVFMVASQNGHTEVVKLLHEYCAQVDSD